MASHSVGGTKWSNYYWALWKWRMKEIHDASFTFVPRNCVDLLNKILSTPVPLHLLKQAVEDEKDEPQSGSSCLRKEKRLHAISPICPPQCPTSREGMPVDDLPPKVSPFCRPSRHQTQARAPAASRDGRRSCELSRMTPTLSVAVSLSLPCEKFPCINTHIVPITLLSPSGGGFYSRRKVGDSGLHPSSPGQTAGPQGGTLNHFWAVR